MGTIILSALVAHTGWPWMIDRWSVFRQFRIEWSAPMVLRLLMVLVAFIAILWFWGADPLVRRRSPDRHPEQEKNPDPATLT
jgi:hypothetical protein